MTKQHSKKSSAPANFHAKRAEHTCRIADALLARGVAQIALRELAALLGTSDRMLLYYFEDKDSLVQASLAEVSKRLISVLGGRISSRKSSPDTILAKALPLFASPAVAPFMTVWADISARGSRNEEPFRMMAHNSVHWWLEWLGSRLDIEDPARRRDTALAILTILEGTRLLENSVPGASKSAVRVLSRALE